MKCTQRWVHRLTWLHNIRVLNDPILSWHRFECHAPDNVDSFVDMSSWSIQDTSDAYPLSWRIAPTQGRQRTMCSTAALDGIDRNQLSAESCCFLGDLAVVSIHPIEVVASTPSQGSTSSVADPSEAGLVSIRILMMSFGMPTVHHTDRLTSSALP